MLNLPIIIFELAMSDLRALSSQENPPALKLRDIAVGRKLLAAAFRYTRQNQDFDTFTLNLISEIIIRCLAFTEGHLVKVRSLQVADRKYRLSNLDLAAMTLYQRAEQLRERVSQIDVAKVAQPKQQATSPQVSPTQTPAQDPNHVIANRPKSSQPIEATDAERMDMLAAAIVSDRNPEEIAEQFPDFGPLLARLLSQSPPSPDPALLPALAPKPAAA